MLSYSPNFTLFSVILSALATVCLTALVFCFVYCLVDPGKVKRLKTVMLVLAVLYAIGTAPLLIRGVSQSIEIYQYQTNSNKQNSLKPVN